MNNELERLKVKLCELESNNNLLKEKIIKDKRAYQTRIAVLERQIKELKENKHNSQEHML